MYKKITALILLILITACSSDNETKHLLWTASSYTAETNGTHVHLSIHSLDGVEDILQADVMIHHVDGSGPSFEVQDASIEQDDDALSFEWTDGFGNKGTAELKALNIANESESVSTEGVESVEGTDNARESSSEKIQMIQFTLKVDEVVNERNMMFIDQYELKKTSHQENTKTKDKELVEKKLPLDPAENN